jgi:hypothetical protein
LQIVEDSVVDLLPGWFVRYTFDQEITCKKAAIQQWAAPLNFAPRLHSGTAAITYHRHPALCIVLASSCGSEVAAIKPEPDPAEMAHRHGGETVGAGWARSAGVLAIATAGRSKWW